MGECPNSIGITVDGATRAEKIELSQKQQRFELTADREPLMVTLDPNTWALMQVRFDKR